MPTVGNRSGGCHSCRKMKVKCDERRPGCHRCEKAGRACPGYREELDNFRSMNKSTELKALEMRDKRRKSREPPTPTTSSLPEEKPVVQVDPGAAGSQPRSSPTTSSSMKKNRGFLAPPMSADWDTQAIHHFFDAFVLPPEPSRSQSGYLDFLPALYAEANHDCYLVDAIKATSFMYLAKRSCLQSFAVQARRSYGKALMEASSNLNIPEEAKSDRMMTALSLLSHYETICSEKPITLALETHASGQAMVMRIRGHDQFKTPRGRSMFRTFNTTLQIKDQIQKRPPTLSMTDWPDDVFLTSQERDASRLMDKVTLLQNRGWSLVEQAQASTMSSTDMLVFLQESRALDQEIQDWRDWAPNQFRPWTTPSYSPSPSNSPAPRPATEYPKEILLFHNPCIAHVWVLMQTARILLLQVMLEINTILAAGGIQLPPTFSWSVLHTQLMETVDSICNSLPYLLNEVDESGRLQVGGNGKPMVALFAVWPLHVVTQVKDIDDSYFAWAMEQLQQIGTMTGCKESITLEKHHMFRRPSILSLDPLEHFHSDV